MWNWCVERSLGGPRLQVTGVDVDPEFIARAHRREKLTDPGIFTGIVADATRLPADIGQFDVVVLNSLLEHVPDWRAAVREAARAVAPGGLLLTTTNRHHPFQGEVNHFPFYPWLPGAVRDRALAWIMKHRRDLVNYSDFPAVHWFSYPQRKSELRAPGLEVYDRLDLMRRAAHWCPLARALDGPEERERRAPRQVRVLPRVTDRRLVRAPPRRLASLARCGGLRVRARERKRAA